MTVKAMEDTLPKHVYLRVNKSYIVNKEKIDSFDSNDVYIGTTEISIGLSCEKHSPRAAPATTIFVRWGLKSGSSLFLYH